MADVHVVAQASRWILEVEGHTRSTHASQAEAIREGRALAQQERGELVIHGRVASMRIQILGTEPPRRAGATSRFTAPSTPRRPSNQ